MENRSKAETYALTTPRYALDNFLGSAVDFAVTHSTCVWKGRAAGLRIVDGIQLPGSHLLPAVRAELLSRLGRPEARDEYLRAAALCSNAAERAVLESKAELAGGCRAAHDGIMARKTSFLSIGSHNSMLSIGSSGSFLSIGSVGSFASIGSAGSAFSVLSIGSFLSLLAILSSLSRWSVLSHRGRASVLRPGRR